MLRSVGEGFGEPRVSWGYKKVLPDSSWFESRLA